MRGSEDPLLLIAGLGQGTWVWRDVLPALERDRPVTTYEARGTGTRVDLPPRRSVDEMVADVLDELDRPAHVLGFSMGGYVALSLAYAHPELVRSLLLFGTGAGGPERVRRPRHVAGAIAEALGLPDDELAERTMPLTFSPGWVEAMPDRYREIIAARVHNPTPYELLEAHGGACFRFYEEDLAVEQIAAPALVAHGDQDLIVPVENGRMLARRLPNAEYVELAGRGHNLMLEDPESFVDVVRRFLGSGSGP
jgi:pimeloyl-ACP methyl ester carboxylesterase